VKAHYTDEASESALYRQSGYAGVNTTVLSMRVSLRMLLVYCYGRYIIRLRDTSCRSHISRRVYPRGVSTNYCTLMPREWSIGLNTYTHKLHQPVTAHPHLADRHHINLHNRF